MITRDSLTKVKVTCSTLVNQTSRGKDTINREATAVVGGKEAWAMNSGKDFFEPKLVKEVVEGI